MADLKSLRVLIVEDDTELRPIITSVFRRYGITVFEATNGAEAYEIVLNNPLDAIVSDVQMPVMDGVSLLKKVKNEFPNLPVVFLITGFADINEEDAKRLGAAGLVHKPFNIKLIIRAIEKAVENLAS